MEEIEHKQSLKKEGTFNHLLQFKWIMMDIIMVLHSTKTLRIDVIIYLYYYMTYNGILKISIFMSEIISFQVFKFMIKAST